MKKVHLLKTAKFISAAVLIMVGCLVVPIKGAVAEFTVTPSLQFDVRYANAASETNMQNGITVFYEALEGGRVALQTGEGAEEIAAENGYYGAGALADHGYVFIGWVNEDEEYLSEEDVYLPLTEEADTKVFAVFEKMEATMEEKAVPEWSREEKKAAAVALVHANTDKDEITAETSGDMKTPEEDPGDMKVPEEDPGDTKVPEEDPDDMKTPEEDPGETTAPGEALGDMEISEEDSDETITPEEALRETKAPDEDPGDTKVSEKESGETTAPEEQREKSDEDVLTESEDDEELPNDEHEQDISMEYSGETLSGEENILTGSVMADIGEDEGIAEKVPDDGEEGKDGITGTDAGEAQMRSDSVQPKPTAEIAQLPAEEVIRVVTPEESEEEKQEDDRQEKENVALNVLCVDATSDEVLAEVQQDAVMTGQQITLSDTIKDNYEVDSVGVYSYISGAAYSNKVAPTFYKSQKNVVSIDTATLTSVIDAQPEEDMTVAFYVSPVQTPLADIRLLSNNQIEQPVNTGIQFDWKLPIILIAWWYGCVTALSIVRRKVPQEKE